MKDELTHVYSNFSYVHAELVSRPKNEELRRDLQKFWGDKRPHFLSDDTSYGFISRTIMSPNIELRYYFDLMETFKLTPLMMEYDGQFVAKNIEKYNLCKPIFFKTRDNLSRNIFERKTVVDFNTYEGELVSNVKTVWGQSLKDFHRTLLRHEFPHAESSIVDITKWFKDTRGNAEMYYIMYLSMFIQNGVLFENFLFEDKEEEIFFHKKVLPSFQFLEKTFGLKPLIYPLLPMENEKRESWLGYPFELANLIPEDIHDISTIQ